MVYDGGGVGGSCGCSISEVGSADVIKGSPFFLDRAINITTKTVTIADKSKIVFIIIYPELCGPIYLTDGPQKSTDFNFNLY